MLRFGSLGKPRVSLEAHEIVTAAMRHGMTEFTSPCVSAGLDVVCRSLEYQADLDRDARLLARNELVTLLARPAAAPSEPEAPRSVTVVATLEPNRLARSIAPLARLLVGERRSLGALMMSMEFERRWHIPEYFEWLATADLREHYQSLVQHCGMTMLCTPQHLERLGEIRAQCDTLRILVVRSRSLDEVAQAYAKAYVAERMRWGSDGHPEQIGKYVRWRIEQLVRNRDDQLDELSADASVSVTSLSLQAIETDDAARTQMIHWLLAASKQTEADA